MAKKDSGLTADTFEGVYLKAAEGAGLAKDAAVARINVLRAKFPDADVPLAVLEQALNDLITPAVLEQVRIGVIADLVALFKSGKGPIKYDPSALA